MKIYKCDRCGDEMVDDVLTAFSIRPLKIDMELCKECLNQLAITIGMWLKPPKPL